MLGFLRRLLGSIPLAKSIRRELKLTPMHKVLKELKRREVDTAKLDALEVFGRCGDWHVQDYVSYVKSIEVWEIEQEFEDTLKRNLPMAEIKITNSFEEVRITKKKFDLIVIDNPMSTYNGHCEHFDLFPDIFRIFENDTIIILNVIPEINKATKKSYPYIFNPEHLSKRSQFYDTNRPDKTSLEEMILSYTKLVSKHGFVLEWSFFIRRSVILYCVLKIKKGS